MGILLHLEYSIPYLDFFDVDHGKVVIFHSAERHDCHWLRQIELRPHTANRTQDRITSFGWEQLDHPPYSSDLAPSDYHLFMHLKKHLAGQRHSDDDEAKTTDKQWLSNQAASFFDDGIQKLVPRCDKCFISNGNYVEK
ncbi:histone-lysine N-methyltransferase SETMAR [Trichonephila clavipes]|uniref:Histone-lysine N-methyltransferase SETMAR n=1 Tax=Trichonephila clavipes TaxID=2585209 RepID=A0A8X6RT73_TRICX|nr:histone-lysine N-methyltransferase SETMAR [Trichonephila clavipes]